MYFLYQHVDADIVRESNITVDVANVLSNHCTVKCHKEFMVLIWNILVKTGWNILVKGLLWPDCIDLKLNKMESVVRASDGCSATVGINMRNIFVWNIF